MRGFLGGIGLGAVVAVLVATAISLVVPLPEPPKVADQAPEDVSAPQTDQPAEMKKPLGDADLVEAAPVGPKDGEVPSDSLSALQDAVTQPADKPEVGGATGTLGEPEETASAPSVSGASDTPVTSSDPSTAPAAPEPEATASISTEPAQPPAPKLIDEDTGFGAEKTEEPQAPQAPEAPKAPVVDESALELTQTAPEQPEQEAEPVTEPQQDPETAADPAPETETTEAVTPEPEPAPVEPVAEAEPDPQPELQEEPQQDTAPRVAALPQAGTEAEPLRPGIGKKVVPLTERGLPVDEAQSADTEPAAPAGKPIEAFAEPFENPEDRPLMSILLIDDGTSVGVEALQDFPYPLSIALDPDLPDAAERMDSYRAAGFEVALIANMDPNAQPQDVETTLPLWMERLPEAVAVLEGTGTGIQGNRGLSDQVSDIVLATGHGLITQNSGLNTVQKLALRDGVPSATVFRDFDGAGQTPAVIRRFLDQAAFRAGQEGAVIMLGRVRPDTISALLLWGLQDRASRVALAPISASLLSNLSSE